MLRDNGRFIEYLYARYAIPGILALLSSAIGAVINTTMAGVYYGEVGLSIVGCFTPLLFLFYTLGALIGVGGANASNKSMSMDDFKPVKSYFSLCTVYTVTVGVVLIILLIGFSHKILPFMAGEYSVTSNIYLYFKYTVLSSICTIYIYVLMNFLRIDGKPRATVHIFLIMTVVNLATNFVLIKAFHMGVEAIAIGSLIGSIAGVLTGVFFLFTKKGQVSFTKPYNIGESTKQILLYGSPMACNNFYNFLKVIIINLIFLKINEPECVAIFAVISTLTTFIMAVSSGLGQSIVPLVAIFNTKLDVESVRTVAKSAFTVGNVIFMIFTIGIIAFNRPLCQYFSMDSASMIENAEFAMVCFAISLIFAVNNVILSFYYAAIDRIWLAHLINFCRGIFFVSIFAVVLSWNFGSKGVFASLVITEVLTLIIVGWIAKFIVLKYFENKKLGSFFFLINNVGISERKYLAFSVASEETAIAEASEKVHEFCNKIGLDLEEAMFISLAVEEILIMIKNNQRTNKRNRNISIRIYIMEEMRMITFMYHGAIFNPIKYFQKELAHDFEKSLEAVGIKYIIERSELVTFAETFGVNNLNVFL